jgi:hypothetical protein
MGRLTFVTTWFRRHGIAYLDMVLGALERAQIVDRLGEGPPKPGMKLAQGEDQYALARAMGYDRRRSGPELQGVDRVVMLLPVARQGLSGARIDQLVSNAKWRQVLESVDSSDPDTDRLLDGLRKKLERDNAFPSLDWIKDEWHGHEWRLWHVILEAPLQTQLDWYREFSPLYRANRNRIQFADLDIEDVHDPGDVTQSMHAWLEREGRGDRLLVNLWGTATAVQFGWYYLAWRRPALKDAVFLKCWTVKKDAPRRFAPITIEVIDKDPISHLSRPIRAAKWERERRRRARGWLEFYLREGDNFSILLLGERGTGKSEAVTDAWKATGHKEEPVSANCANFKDPEQARSELFGHVEGAFTGAIEDREGLLETADGGVLFLDEVHLLDAQTRSMLLTALQTNKEGQYSFTRLGDVKDIRVRFQPVFASNSERALMEELPADFLDRISQRLLRWPSIEKGELEGAWNEVWERMKFMGARLTNPIEEEWFLPWLAERELPGNFRDLQRIAILVADFSRVRASVGDDSVLIPPEWTLRDYLEESLREQIVAMEDGQRLQTAPSDPIETTKGIVVQIDLGAPAVTHWSYLDACRREFARAMTRRFGSQTEAVEELRKRGAKMTPSTFSRWSKSG